MAETLHLDPVLSEAFNLNKIVQRTDFGRAVAQAAGVALADDWEHSTKPTTLFILAGIGLDAAEPLIDGKVSLANPTGGRIAISDVGAQLDFLLDIGCRSDIINGGELIMVVRNIRELARRRARGVWVDLMRFLATQGRLRIV